MKALILAAGFGTRLMPYTGSLPKPLFTLGSQTMLELAVQSLVDCGCDHILINTHHLHQQIHAALEEFETHVHVQAVHEKQILETGGAIANIRPFLDDTPFFVVNADVVSSLDLKALYGYHLASGALATLAVHDHRDFNCLKVDENGCIRNFKCPEHGLAFTGIQVLSPNIFENFPQKHKFSSIQVYESLCPTGKIRAFRAPNLFWRDMGTPFSYRETARRWIAGKALGTAIKDLDQIRITSLCGDGSDRAWYRAQNDCQGARRPGSVVISDHGICPDPSDNLDQIRSFVRIGRHLNQKGIQVPRILSWDEFSGMVALEDLGDHHLADRVKGLDRPGLIRLYKRVINSIIEFSKKGIQGFDPAWTCQTPTYSRELILEKECRYFTEAFLGIFLGKKTRFSDLEQAFGHIADMALKHPVTGLMHRDMQSRNIMVRDERIFFIDFQSARTGPLQYDLASLLIDPYVKLPRDVRQELLGHALSRLGMDQLQAQDFTKTFEYCCLTRNLQILGAFGFLSRVKKKAGFEAFIPRALYTLKSIVSDLKTPEIMTLSDLVQTL